MLKYVEVVHSSGLYTRVLLVILYTKDCACLLKSASPILLFTTVTASLILVYSFWYDSNLNGKVTNICSNITLNDMHHDQSTWLLRILEIIGV